VHQAALAIFLLTFCIDLCINVFVEEKMDKKEISITIRLTAETHKALKLLSASEGKTAKECIMEALDKTFPGWRNITVKK